MRASPREDITLYEFELLATHPALIAGCTGRAGGVSEPPYDTLNLGLHVEDDREAVLENRRRLAGALGVEPESFVIPHQIHRGRVTAVGTADRRRGTNGVEDAVPDTDALITRDTGVVLATIHADCVPIILFDPLTPAIGVAHAGWGGTVHHVARNTVDAMRGELGSDPASLLAGIGPSIGPASYEVGAEVAERAEAEFPAADVVRARGNGKFLLDLWQSNVADLVSAGVPRSNIELAGIDTYQSVERFFSDRRRRPTGRFLAVAMLVP
jgi:YfiH family protein